MTKRHDAMSSFPRERLVEHALALIVEHESSPTSQGEAAAALTQWRSKSAEHEAAAREARGRWDALGGMAESLRSHFDAHPHQQGTRDAPRPSQGSRRRQVLLSGIALLAGGALAGRGAWWYWRQPTFAKAYDTRIAQLLQVVLPDGQAGGTESRIDLAPRSAIDVTLYRDRRIVRMDAGEVRFDVARDADRPFVVTTREARIEVVGTVFTVRDRGGFVSVGVERGLVSVRPLLSHDVEGHHGMRGAINVGAGQSVEIREGRATPVRTASTATMSAWRDGWLVFENTPLNEALKTINAYRANPIVSVDARVDALRLSGRFRANDSAGLVAALPMILPLTVRPLTGGGVELSAR